MKQLLLGTVVLATWLGVVLCGITEYSSRDDDEDYDPFAFNPNDNTIMAKNVIVLPKGIAPVDSGTVDSVPVYTCLDGNRPLVASTPPTRESYFCSSKLGNVIHKSEQEVTDMCNNDPKCTGYQYRSTYNFGYLCKQDEYPGSSRKDAGWKLCKKPVFVYTCLDGARPLVASTPTRESYFCSTRLGNPIQRKSEQEVTDMCNNNAQCTGYDYKGSQYGSLCKQNEYPGSSKKYGGYKLCKKTVASAVAVAFNLDDLNDAEELRKWTGVSMNHCLVHCMVDKRCNSINFDDFGGAKAAVCRRSILSYRDPNQKPYFKKGSETSTTHAF